MAGDAQRQPVAQRRGVQPRGGAAASPGSA